MAQISYGSITIVDTNDVESLTVEYSRNQNPSSAPESDWGTNRPQWQEGYYIWQRVRIHKSGTDPSLDSFGTAVCLTGSTGNTGGTGKGISSIVTTYCNYGIGTPAANYQNWQSTIPTYDSSKPNYWIKTVINYDNNTSADPIIVKDNGLTDAIEKAASANLTADALQNDLYGTITGYSYTHNDITETVYVRSDGSFYYIDSTTQQEIDIDGDDVQPIFSGNSLIDTINNTSSSISDLSGQLEVLQGLNTSLQNLSQQAYDYSTEIYNQLSQVQNIVDWLEWANKYGDTTDYVQTTDTSIQKGIYYFEKINDQYRYIQNPEEVIGDNTPAGKGWYVLNELKTTLVNYITTHLSLTNEGLFVQTDANEGTRIKLTGNGMYLYVKGQNQPVAQYTNEVILGAIDDIHIVLSSNHGLQFFKGFQQEPIAWIDSNILQINQAAINDNFRIGDFLWKKQATVNNVSRISLVYSPLSS